MCLVVVLPSLVRLGVGERFGVTKFFALLENRVIFLNNSAEVYQNEIHEPGYGTCKGTITCDVLGRGSSVGMEFHDWGKP